MEAVQQKGGELVGVVLVVAGEHRVVLRQRPLECLRRQRRDSLFAGLPERFEECGVLAGERAARAEEVALVEILLPHALHEVVGEV